jgi:hypothetical protein
MSNIYYTSDITNSQGNGKFYQRPLFLTKSEVNAGIASGIYSSNEWVNHFNYDPSPEVFRKILQMAKESKVFEFLNNHIPVNNPFGKAKLKVYLPITQYNRFADLVFSVNHTAWL